LARMARRRSRSERPGVVPGSCRLLPKVRRLRITGLTIRDALFLLSAKVKAKA
jgi:hypothetical protein